MSRKKCCIRGCMESGRSHKTLHLFPNPIKDKDRFNQWIYSIGLDIIGLDNEDIFKHRSICHAHFEQKYCCRYNKLSNIAVPTLNLPGPLSLAKLPSVDTMRQIQTLPKPSSTSVHSTELLTSVCPCPAAPPTSATSTDLAVRTPTVETNHKLQRDAIMDENSSMTPAPPKDFHTIHQGCHKVKHAKTVKKHLIMTPAEQMLRHKLIKMQVKLSKCRNTVKNQSAYIKAAKV